MVLVQVALERVVVARVVMQALVVRVVMQLAVLPEQVVEAVEAVQPELSVMVLIKTVAEVQAEAVSAFLVRVLTEQPVPVIIPAIPQPVVVAVRVVRQVILFPVVRPALLGALTAAVEVEVVTFSTITPSPS